MTIDWLVVHPNKRLLVNGVTLFFAERTWYSIVGTAYVQPIKCSESPEQHVGLKIEIPPEQRAMINGATLIFRNRTRFIVEGPGSILRNAMIMLPEQAKSPVERLYFALQTCYMQQEAERKKSLTQLASLMDAAGDSIDESVRQSLVYYIERDDLFRALRVLFNVLKRSAISNTAPALS